MRPKGLATGTAASPAKRTPRKALAIKEAEIEVEEETNAKSRSKIVITFNSQ